MLQKAIFVVHSQMYFLKKCWWISSDVLEENSDPACKKGKRCVLKLEVPIAIEQKPTLEFKRKKKSHERAMIDGQGAGRWAVVGPMLRPRRRQWGRRRTRSRNHRDKEQEKEEDKEAEPQLIAFCGLDPKHW